MEYDDFIQKYIENEISLLGGHFLFFDQETRRPLALNFHGINPKRIHSIGQAEFMACVDMSTDDGQKYDLDFFVKTREHGDFEVTNITIHCAQDQLRYKWYEEGGIYKQQPVSR